MALDTHDLWGMFGSEGRVTLRGMTEKARLVRVQGTMNPVRGHERVFLGRQVEKDRQNNDDEGNIVKDVRETGAFFLHGPPDIFQTLFRSKPVDHPMSMELIPMAGAQ